MNIRPVFSAASFSRVNARANLPTAKFPIPNLRVANVRKGILSAAVIIASLASGWANAGPDRPPIDYSLSALHEACEPFIANARASLADADAARYCLQKGEAIVIKSSATRQDTEYAKETIRGWLEEVNRGSVAYQQSLAFNP